MNAFIVVSGICSICFPSRRAKYFDEMANQLAYVLPALSQRPNHDRKTFSRVKPEEIRADS
jgi:hypothetical protein